MYRVGIDVGGTFTDLALLRGDTLVLDKVLSTPADSSQGVMAGLERLAEREKLSLREFLSRCDAIVHGTTVADNTLIQMNGALTGMLTTEGFRDQIELRRGFKEDIWDVRLPPPTPIAPRRRRLGVPERIRFDGTIHTPLDEAAARRAIQRLARQGVESVAICTLFSFVNPVHEKRLAELVAEELPGAEVSLSHEVLPKAPEFERASTTVVNAYVGPRVTRYLARLAERLRESGYANPLLIVQGSGGVMTLEYLRGSSVRVLSSGPAAGVVGGGRFGAAKGALDLLCVDMGGTSYDMALVRDGTAPAEGGWNLHHRWVVSTPMVPVQTLGAGGGSLCHVENGVLQVGPRSAGADPGPVCYGRGGTRPTVTDACLVMGLLSEDAEFAGGRLRLTRKGVDEAFERHVAGPLGCSVAQAAFDAWRVVNANMTQAVRRATAERGVDPRELTLLAYGGNGPGFAAIQAQELGIARVLVPRASPAFSALGALAARPSIDEERSYLAPASRAEASRLRELWLELDRRAEEHFKLAGFPRSELIARYQLNLRYPGQNWPLSIDVAEVKGKRDLAFASDEQRSHWIEAFHRRHEQEYGHFREGEEPEICGVRLISSVEVAGPRFGGRMPASLERPKPARRRRANLGRGYQPADIFLGRDLRPGHEILGSAIIEESFTTIVVYPGWKAAVDEAGDYVLTRA